MAQAESNQPNNAIDKHWSKTPKTLLTDKRISHGAARLYLLIASRAGPSGRIPDRYSPTIAQLADEIGASESSVQNWRAELEASGWIVCDTKRGARTRYEIIQNADRAAVVEVENAAAIARRRQYAAKHGRKGAKAKALINEFRRNQTQPAGCDQTQPAGCESPNQTQQAGPLSDSKSQTSSEETAPRNEHADDGDADAGGIADDGLSRTSEAPDPAAVKAARQWVGTFANSEPSENRRGEAVQLQEIMRWPPHVLNGGLVDPATDPKLAREQIRTLRQRVQRMVAEGDISGDRYEALECWFVKIDPGTRRIREVLGQVAAGVAYIGQDGAPIYSDQGGGQAAVAVAS